ncbi:hypothetical protein SNL152K_810 [Streptomyces sp. NL15-2K]|nr:hypothetical protein SNL152K_810 [Streptomyces sp. NL15-2K]
MAPAPSSSRTAISVGRAAQRWELADVQPYVPDPCPAGLSSPNSGTHDEPPADSR